jgi:hypothetical protein
MWATGRVQQGSPIVHIAVALKDINRNFNGSFIPQPGVLESPLAMKRKHPKQDVKWIRFFVEQVMSCRRYCTICMHSPISQVQSQSNAVWLMNTSGDRYGVSHSDLVEVTSAYVWVHRDACNDMARSVKTSCPRSDMMLSGERS